MSLLLTTGTAPMLERMLSVGDWFVSTRTEASGVTGRTTLALPYGSPGGFRTRWPVRAGQTIQARIEGGPTITWGGASSVTATADGYVWSDHVPYLRTGPAAPVLRTYTAGPVWTHGSYDRVTSWQWGDALASDGPLGFTTGGPMCQPDAIVGPSPAGPSMLIVGDSIAAAAGAYPEVAARLAGVPAYNVGTGGEHSATFLATADAKPGDGLQWSHWTHVLHQHAVNDTTSTSWQQVAAGRISCWAWAASRGLLSVQLTCLPVTDSTDGWTTIEGQTPRAANLPGIAGINTWLRDGAPVTDGAAVDPGTSGALRAGDPGHPLDAVWDTAGTAYPAGYTDRWRVPGWGGDGVHPTTLAHQTLATPLAALMSTL